MGRCYMYEMNSNDICYLSWNLIFQYILLVSIGSSHDDGKNFQIIERAIFNTEKPAITLSVIREWLRLHFTVCEIVFF